MKVDKPGWDDIFLAICYVIAERSGDNSTKHGCLLIDEENVLLSAGFNGTLRGIEESKVPKERPDKYFYWIHAEENSILNAARNGIKIKNATAYITGAPCVVCLRKLLQIGVKKILYGNKLAKLCTDKDQKKHSRKLLALARKRSKIEYRQLDTMKVKNILENIIKCL